jgi:hypothetical protein
VWEPSRKARPSDDACIQQKPEWVSPAAAAFKDVVEPRISGELKLKFEFQDLGVQCDIVRELLLPNIYHEF